MYGYYIKNKIIFIILISFLFFSSKSYCKWEWVSGSSQLGSVDIYVDFERIVKKEKYRLSESAKKCLNTKKLLLLLFFFRD